MANKKEPQLNLLLASIFIKRFHTVLLFLIIFFGLVLRMYKFDAPLADWHSWRQADTASVARNYVHDGIDLLYPKYDDLSNIQSGIYNPEGYRFVEFPLYNASFAFLYTYAPIFSLEAYGRLVSIFMSIILILILYYFVLKEHSKLAALVTAFVFSVYPFFVYYSRSVLPEMTALSMMFLGIFLLYVSYKKSHLNRLKKYLLYFISIIFTATAILIKPTTAFYFFVPIYIFFCKHRFSTFKRVHVYLFFLLSIVPFFLWRWWIARFPEGIPAYQWLLFHVNTPEGLENIFFRPAFFRWIFYERIQNLIMGGYAVSFIIIGFLSKIKKNALFNSMAFSAMCYLFVFQGGNLQHDYYQVMILPVLAIYCGIGVQTLINERRIFTSRIISVLSVLFILIFSLFISYYKVIDYYRIDTNLVQSAKIIQTLTKPEDKIVTDTLGDTTLLYVSDRKGYPAVTKPLEDIKRDGFTYFVTFKKDIIEDVKKEYMPIFESDNLYIFSL